MAGSGAVSPNDMRLGWPALMHRTLADLAFSHNRRMDGRGLHNSRRLHLQVWPCMVRTADEAWQETALQMSIICGRPLRVEVDHTCLLCAWPLGMLSKRLGQQT